MPRRMNDPKPKPIEKWGVAEWQAAYDRKNSDFEQLKKEIRGISIFLHKALSRIQETLN